MFKAIEKYKVDQRILNCDYLSYSPSELSTINTGNSQFNNNILREVSVISLLSHLDMYFDVLYAGTKNRYADNNEIRLVNLGPIALIRN